MIIRKSFNITACRLVCIFALAGLTGCSTIKSIFHLDRNDYNKAGLKAPRKLEVPPDLVQMQSDDRYSIPEGGAVTASGYGRPGTAPAPQQAHAKVVKDQSGSHIEMDEGFDRAWRRVGLALDRAGFTVEDRDRSQGVFYVRYLDLGAEGDRSSVDPGFFARLFSGKKKKTAQRYRVTVKEAGDSASHIAVLNDAGAPEKSATGERILSVLAEQLK